MRGKCESLRVILWEAVTSHRTKIYPIARAVKIDIAITVIMTIVIGVLDRTLDFAMYK